MPRLIHLDEVSDRPVRDVLRSGLSQLAFGLIMLVWGGILFLRFVPVRPGVALGLVMAGCIIGCFCFRAIPGLMRRLQETVVLPRIGHVEFSQTNSSRTVWRVLSLIGLGSVAVLVWRMAGSSLIDDSVIGAGYALVLTGSLLFSGIKYRMPDMVCLAILSSGLGAVVFWSLAGRYSFSWMWAGLGAAFLLDGVWRLKHFADTHPKVEAP